MENGNRTDHVVKKNLISKIAFKIISVALLERLCFKSFC